MSSNYNPQDPYHGGWYKSINPNEHEYTPGYGFSHRPPIIVESALIARYSVAIAMSMITIHFISNMVVIFFDVLFQGYALYDASIQLIYMLSSILAFTVPAFLLRSYIKIPIRKSLPVRRVPFSLTLCALLISLAVSSVGYYALVMATFILNGMGLYFSAIPLAVPIGLPGLILYGISITVVPAIFEEIFFRGVIMQSLRRFGDGFALLTSSLLFSLMHITPDRFPHSFLMGLIIGYFVLFTGSVKTGMLIHFVHNFFILLQVIFIPQNPFLSEYLPFLVNFLYLVSGVGALMVMLNRYGGIFLMKSSETLNSQSSKLRTFWLTPAMVIVLTLSGLLSLAFLA